MTFERVPEKFKHQNQVIMHYMNRAGPNAASNWERLTSVVGQAFFERIFPILITMPRTEILTRIRFFNCIQNFSIEQGTRRPSIVIQTVQSLFDAAFVGNQLPKEFKTIEEVERYLKPLMPNQESLLTALNALKQGPLMLSSSPKTQVHSYAVFRPLFGPIQLLFLANSNPAPLSV